MLAGQTSGTCIGCRSAVLASDASATVGSSCRAVFASNAIRACRNLAKTELASRAHGASLRFRCTELTFATSPAGRRTCSTEQTFDTHMAFALDVQVLVLASRAQIARAAVGIAVRKVLAGTAVLTFIVRRRAFRVVKANRAVGALRRSKIRVLANWAVCATRRARGCLELAFVAIDTRCRCGVAVPTSHALGARTSVMYGILAGRARGARGGTASGELPSNAVVTKVLAGLVLRLACSAVGTCGGSGQAELAGTASNALGAAFVLGKRSQRTGVAREVPLTALEPTSRAMCASGHSGRFGILARGARLA